jgi:hypothetical protein
MAARNSIPSILTLRYLIIMSSFFLSWTGRSQTEAEVDPEVVPAEFDRQWGKWLGAFDGSRGEHIDRLIAGGLVDLRLDNGPVTFDPEIDHYASEVLLRAYPVLFDTTSDLPQIVGEGKIG